MIFKHLSSYLLLSLLLVSFAWSQERAARPAKEFVARQALVIGNAAYSHAGKLRNPVNDAKAIGSTLKRLGFKVKIVTDANQRKMETAIREFGKDLISQNSAGLFYYAGHGMQIEGENYLLPTDINPSNESDVTYDAVHVGKLLGQMQEADNGMNIVILDACRNNPFARNFRSASQGLAQVNAPSGSFVSYSTAPGKIAADGNGENGLFTSKLLKYMIIPGLRIEEVFKKVRKDVQLESNNQQIPWESSSITGDFFFVEPKDEEEILRRREEEILRKEEEILRRREEEILRKEEEILRRREEEILRKEEEILQKLEEKIQEKESLRDDKPGRLEKTNKKNDLSKYQNLQVENSLRRDSSKFKIMGGYASGSLSLEKDTTSTEEEFDVPSLLLSGRYFFSQNIGLEFTTAGGSVREIKFSDSSEEYQEQADGIHNTTLIGISYNWGGYKNSIFGNWWTVLAGLGVGSSAANYTVENSQEEMTVAFQGLAIILGFDYRTENNWLFGLTFYQVSGSPTGSRVEQLESDGSNVTARTFLGAATVGYQFN